MFEYDKVLGKLPSPFLFEDGSPVRTAEDWRKKRLEILDTPLRIEFGGMPPRPEVLTFEALPDENDGRTRVFRILAGTKQALCPFTLRLFLPASFDSRLSYPILLTGDGCWADRFCTPEVINSFNDRGFIYGLFDRTELALDDRQKVRESGLYLVYPDAPFSTISAWAFGYHLALDLLLTLPYVRPDAIAITGHSRGGKAVLLAGATDERIRFVCPNGSGTHGCGCYRYEQFDPFNPDEQRSEPLYFMREAIPDWLGSELFGYIGQEATLPYDMHFFKALIAPRYFLETEAFGDLWANPVGSYQSFLAAKRVFDFLGVSDHALIHYREGKHFHKPEDLSLIADLVTSVLEGKAPGKELTGSYFEGLNPIFDF